MRSANLAGRKPFFPKPNTRFIITSNRRGKKVIELPFVHGKLEVEEPPPFLEIIAGLEIENEKLKRRVSALENQLRLVLYHSNLTIQPSTLEDNDDL